MAKEKTKNGGVMNEEAEISNGFSLRSIFNTMTTNASLMRSELVSKLFDPRRDIAKEAGYPETITRQMYRRMYDREGVGKRVVHFWPEESWVIDPLIFETEDAKLSTWEEEVEKILTKQNAFHFLERLDVQSGIGRYGVMLLGFNDGLDLKAPVANINEKGEPVGKPSGNMELLFMRVFSEESVEIAQRDPDIHSSRFGMPVLYNVRLSETSGATRAGVGTGSEELVTERSEQVHWTRIIHLADNKEQSETLGAPRMQVVWNRLLDDMKVMGGSGEMFWKGAFPGYSIETLPDMPDVDLDVEGIRAQLSNYFNGLQRYLALTGVSVKSLTPQMGDPTAHKEVIMKEIAFSLGVPWRKFIGSEQAQLASQEDSRSFNNRVKRRQDKHLTPCLVRVFLDRLMAVGVLPPIEEYHVEWPDLNTVTDLEKAEVSAKATEALAKYVSSGLESIFGFEEFLSIVMKFDPEEVEQIMNAHDEMMAARDEIEEEAAAMALEIAEQQAQIPVGEPGPPKPSAAKPPVPAQKPKEPAGGPKG